MIFIKNCTKNLSGEDFKLTLEENPNNATLFLSIDGDEDTSDVFKIATTSIPEVVSSIKHSMDYIGKATNFELKDTMPDLVIPGENVNYYHTHILSNKPTEISFFVKNTKTILKVEDDSTTEIGLYEESENEKNRYPRDMIALVLPNRISVDDENEEVSYEISVDSRNLGAPIKRLKSEDYTVILVFIRYPIWANFKFPAYICINYKYINKILPEGERPKVNPYSAFKLGSINNKNLQKNQIIDVDYTEAHDYLENTFKELRERKANNNNNNRNNYNRDGRRPHNNNGNFKYKNSSRPNNRNYNNNKRYK
jgi:hypothetical protein